MSREYCSKMVKDIDPLEIVYTTKVDFDIVDFDTFDSYSSVSALHFHESYLSLAEYYRESRANTPI